MVVNPRRKRLARPANNVTLTKKVNKLTKLVGKPEVKHHSNYLSSVDITDKGNGTNQVFVVNAPAQGDTDISRDGDKLRMLSLALRGNLIVADTTNVVRMIVFQIYDGGVSGLLEDVIEASDSSGRQWRSPYKHDNAGKFKILYDRTYSLGDASKQQVTFNKLIRFSGKNAYVGFLNGTTTIQKNTVYVAFVSDSAAISHPTMNIYYRLRYTDV